MSNADSPLVPCHEAVRQLWDYLEGAVSPAAQAQVDDHLAYCRRCCGELEFVSHLRELLASQATEDMPRPTIERLERFVEEL